MSISHDSEGMVAVEKRAKIISMIIQLIVNKLILKINYIVVFRINMCICTYVWYRTFTSLK